MSSSERTTQKPPSVALIACDVLEAEIAALMAEASHVVRQEVFEMGLHDQPGVLRIRLAEAIARAEADPRVEAVVLVYGLCGTAIAGLAPARVPLVVPRAHDCITLFLGSKERYAECMKADPALYWYTPGWNRGGRVPGPERTAKLRREYEEKFGPEEADALLEMEREAFAQHNGAAYTDLRMQGDDAHVCHAKASAASLGWGCTVFDGNRALLNDLVWGRWDAERFLVLQPGSTIAMSVGPEIVKAVPAKPTESQSG